MYTGIEAVLFLQDLRQSMPGWVESFFLLLSSPVFYIVLPMIIGAFSYWFVSKKGGETILFSISLAMAASRTLKFIVKQPRPWVLDPSVEPSQSAMKGATTYSLPSGHTSISVPAYASIFRLMESRYVRAFCILMIVLIPFSRVFLGVHTPLDIAVGFIIGIAVFLINNKAVPWSYENERNRMVYLVGYSVFFVLCTIVILLLGGDVRSIDFLGLGLGLTVGLLIDGRYIHHDVISADLRGMTAMAVIGFVISGILFIIPYFTMGTGFGSMLGGFLFMLSVTVICPLIFRKIGSGAEAPGSE